MDLDHFVDYKLIFKELYLYNHIYIDYLNFDYMNYRYAKVSFANEG